MTKSSPPKKRTFYFMDWSERLFYFFILFFVGVALSWIGLGWWVVFILLALILLFSGLVFFFWEKNIFLLAVIVVIGLAGGYFYNVFYERAFFNFELDYGKNLTWNGKIVSYPKRMDSYQSFLFQLNSGPIVTVALPNLYFLGIGNKLTLRGEINPLNDKNNYLRKDRVLGEMRFPAVNLIKKDNPSIRGTLASFKSDFLSTLSKNLKKDNLSLVGGMILGDDAVSFSPQLKEQMKKSGTTHLVALSGYNVSILVIGLYFILGFLFFKKAKIVLAVLLIVIFVLLTGAEASIVRASIMGVLFILAQNFSRVYSFRHAAVWAAFFMVVQNPLVLFYDIGFWLSFLALLGITYLAPAIKNSLGNVFGNLSGLVIDVISAQLMVLPLLSYFFGEFSLFGFLANALILPLVPFVMLFGFLLGIFGLFSNFLALVISLPTYLLSLFQIMVIKVFSLLPVIEFSMAFGLLVIYYALIFIFIYTKRGRLNEYV